MKNILHVSASPRGKAAESYRLSQKIIDLLLRKEPGATVVNRVIGDGTMPHVDENYAISQGSTADVSKGGSMILSEKLIREVENSDCQRRSKIRPMGGVKAGHGLRACETAGRA